MLQTVKKRDGRIVGYTEEKVKCALRKAMYETDKGVDETLIQKITDKVTMNEASTLGVEDIQDIIEKELLKSARKDVAKLYITYRHKRDVARKAKTREIFFEIINAEKNDITRENANMNADTPAGMMMKFASETTKPFVNDYLLADDVREAFESNYIHIHDADMYPSKSLTCLEGNTNITIMLKDGHPMFTEMKYFDQFFDSEPTQDPTLVIFDSSDEDIMIEGRNGWTRVLNVSRRYMSDEDTFFRLGNENTEEELHVTGTHQIPVVDKNDGLTILKTVYEIQIGDLLIKDGLDQLVEVTFKDEINKDGIIVYDIETEDHYFVANGYVVHNCVQHPLDKILNDGFMAGHGESRPAKRIETASVISCISMETAQNEMHGGQAIPAFDFYMAPFVRKSYIEEVKKIEELMDEDLSELYNADIKDYETHELDGMKGMARYKQQAINQTVQRVHQAMEAFIHNMNSIHSRGGNQVVFSSINYGTDTSAEGRCVIRELLKSTYRGVGNGSTAIFPIQIWKKKRGVSYLPEDPNYDLYKLACKVTARRFFPNFLNLDATFNQDSDWDENDPKRYEHEVATMGCVDGKEIVTYQIEGDNEVHVVPFKQMWDDMAARFTTKSQTEEGFDCGEFIDLNNVKIQDKDGMVECLRIIKNPDKGDWYKVTMSNGRVLTCTSDHPWGVISDDGKKVVITTEHLEEGDKIELIDTQLYTETNSKYSVNKGWLYGFILCDGCYDGQMMSTVAMNETDIAEHYQKTFKNEFGFNVAIREQHRGVKGDYLELKLACPNGSQEQRFKNSLISEFHGLRKIERTIPSWVFNAPREVRVSFLAGMTDADGYLSTHRDRVKIQLGSTNKALAIQTAMLAQTLGLPSKMYNNHYCGEKIRVFVEFDATSEIVNAMTCNKKKEKFVAVYGEPIKFNEDIITKIEYIGERDECSYDVTTSSEYFNVSGIRSHNCRTRVFENRFGPKTSIGRGNLSFTTINIVKLAIECMNIENKEERINMFFAKLDHMLDIAAKQLNDRFEFQKTALVKQFPLLMSKLWIGSEKLSPNDTIESVINQGTLGIGFIGLAECLIALIGKHHGESEEAQELGLKIITYMRDRVNDFCEQYQHNYSVLATPAEGLSGKFTKKDRQQFGVIPGVTDKEYYTNSNHVPVYYHCSPRHKAEIEAPYHNITRGGHIFYVEIDGDATHNPEAIMNIVDLMDEYNIGYGSVNHNRNRCMDCGYEDATEGLKVCPKCGSTHIDTLQRITGYLVGTTDRWNSGKIAELNDRVVHK